MMKQKEVEAQLEALGIKVRYIGRPELRELPQILMPHERIINLINGRYKGGFASLIATDLRVLLVDKKPWYLTVEDIRYDMIAEVDYNARLLDSTVCIITVNKTLQFTSIRQNRLRELTNFIQWRVMEIRQHTTSYNGDSAQPGYKELQHSAHQSQYSQPSDPQPRHRYTRGLPNPYLKSSFMTRQRYTAKRT